MAIRSDRLKKLEAELNDLRQWLELGLVPKGDIEKHEKEIAAIKSKIEDEEDKIKFLKENNEIEEYVTPKRSSQKPAFSDTNVNNFAVSDDEQEDFEEGNEENESDDDDDDDDFDHFSDKARSRRSWDALDPDADDW